MVGMKRRLLLLLIMALSRVQIFLPQLHVSAGQFPPKLSSFDYPSRSPINNRKLYCNCQKMETVVDAPKLRAEFMKILRSRRCDEVPLSLELVKPIVDHMSQGISSEAIESFPKENIVNFKDQLREEKLYLITEACEQGRVPVLILSMKDSKNQRKPAVVFLHSTNSYKEQLRPLLEAYASRGYIAVAIDSRYHGERASNTSTYQDVMLKLPWVRLYLTSIGANAFSKGGIDHFKALVLSWKNGDTMPFIFDTVWDLIKLADYLSEREDIDPSRIGIMGVSLGGMHAWFAAAVETRYAVVVPIIGVQGFRWAIDNDKWQARVDSIKPVFEEAQVDLAKEAIDKEVVEKVWDRIAPGLASQFDSPQTIPVIAPRPLLILNGAEDPRCPLGGLEIPISRTNEVYREANCSENFKMIAQPGIGHQFTPLMVKEASDWFDKFLN